MTRERKLTFALLGTFLSGIVASGLMYFYVGYAISESHRPLCRLTVPIEDGGRASGEVLKSVKDMNRDYDCRRLVRDK